MIGITDNILVTTLIFFSLEMLEKLAEPFS